jgi:hypothetical protein
MMAKMIRTTVDADGNVRVDFSGFTGNDCLPEEDRLRHSLAEFGILTSLGRVAHKQAATVERAVQSTKGGQ